ncbi:hypothetical protein [Desulfonatronum parangueonense]
MSVESDITLSLFEAPPDASPTWVVLSPDLASQTFMNGNPGRMIFVVEQHIDLFAPLERPVLSDF